MFSDFFTLKNEKIEISLLIALISIFPLFILLGSAFINSFVILTSLIFLYYSYKEKKFLFLKNYYFILLIVFFFTLLINIFLSKYGTEDYSRQIGFLISIFGALGFLITGSYLKTNLPFSIGFLNVPAFLIFIPITTFMARIGARTVHKIDKNKISKLFGIFLLVIAIKFLFEYLKL